MTEDEKNWIDNATYKQLLDKWRNAPAGDSFFTLETGEYFGEVMEKRKAELSNAETVGASKDVGW